MSNHYKETRTTPRRLRKMPFYTYTDNKTGEANTRMVPIAERDKQRGMTRVLEFPTARLGLAENPHTQAYGVRQGLKDLEEKVGRQELQKQLGPDLNLKHVKQLWEGN